MSSSDAAPESKGAEGGSVIPKAATSVLETVAPSVARRFGSEKFAAATGAISLLRAVQSFRKGDRRRGLVRALVGLFWIGVVLARRRRDRGPSGSELSDVADTGPDIESAVAPGERDAERSIGEDVVDTANADIDESDTAPEVETSAELERETDREDVDQREVAMSDEVASTEEAAERGDAETESDEAVDADSDAEVGETDTGTDETEFESETDDEETGSEPEPMGESDEDADEET